VKKSKSPVAYARGSECGGWVLPNRDREGAGAVVLSTKREKFART